MSKNIKKRNRKAKAGASLAFSTWLFVTILLFSIAITIYCYIIDRQVTVETTATIVSLDDWKFTCNLSSKIPESRGNFYNYYYLCEFTDATGTKRSGIYNDSQKVSFFHDTNYQEHIKYKSGDTVAIYYYPEDFIDGGSVYNVDNNNNNKTPLLLIIFWGATTITFFLYLSDRKKYNAL